MCSFGFSQIQWISHVCAIHTSNQKSKKPNTIFNNERSTFDHNQQYITKVFFTVFFSMQMSQLSLVSNSSEIWIEIFHLFFFCLIICSNFASHSRMTRYQSYTILNCFHSFFGCFSTMHRQIQLCVFCYFNCPISSGTEMQRLFLFLLRPNTFHNFSLNKQSSKLLYKIDILSHHCMIDFLWSPSINVRCKRQQLTKFCLFIWENYNKNWYWALCNNTSQELCWFDSDF